MKSQGWGPNPLGQLSFQEEEELQKSLPLGEHREKNARYEHRKEVPSANQGHRFHQTAALMSPSPWPFRFQNSENIHLHCRGHPVCGVLFWQSQHTDPRMFQPFPEHFPPHTETRCYSETKIRSTSFYYGFLQTWWGKKTDTLVFIEGGSKSNSLHQPKREENRSQRESLLDSLESNSLHQPEREERW